MRKESEEKCGKGLNGERCQRIDEEKQEQKYGRKKKGVMP